MTPPAARRIHPSMLAASMLSLIIGCAQTLEQPRPQPAESVDKSKAYTALAEIKPVPEFPAAQSQPATDAVPQAQRYLETGRQRFDEEIGRASCRERV